MQAVIPYLTFKGNCREVIDFYAACFNGTLEQVSTFAELPTEVADEFKDKILHAVLKAGNLTLMFSDTTEATEATVIGNSISMGLHFDDVATMQKTFDALAEGGIITMPLEDTFWGARFGKLSDKFGISWLFNYDYPKKEA